MNIHNAVAFYAGLVGMFGMVFWMVTTDDLNLYGAIGGSIAAVGLFVAGIKLNSQSK